MGPWLSTTGAAIQTIIKSWILKSALKKLICQERLPIQEAQGNLLLKYFRTHSWNFVLPYSVQHREVLQM